jgi:chemotaxis protein CheD
MNSQKLRPVPIAEIVMSADPDEVLVAYGIGSCVVICLYDPAAKVGGMLHALLPAAPSDNGHTAHPAKFVAEGVPLLLDSLLALGAHPGRLVTRLCGGARTITKPDLSDSLNIGERNILAAQTALQMAGLKVKSQAIGGQGGRTVKLYLADGRVTIRMLGQAEYELA